MNDLLNSIKTNSKFILAFEHKNSQYIQMEEVVPEESVLIDLSVSSELKNEFMDEFKLTSLPVIIYKGSPIYSVDNFASRVEVINLSYYKEFLTEFINKAKFAIFMKGTPQNPYCKYSKTLMRLLGENKIENFVTENIFEDEDMRNSLKSIVGWQTYPMVFVDGEFIGGLDLFEKYLGTNY